MPGPVVEAGSMRMSRGIMWPPAGGLSTHLNEKLGLCGGCLEQLSPPEGIGKTTKKVIVQQSLEGVCLQSCAGGGQAGGSGRTNVLSLTYPLE